MKRLASILIIVFAIIIFSNLVFAQNNVLPNLQSIARSETGLYTAVGDAGLIITSEDGISWNKVSSVSLENLNEVTWAMEKFIAVGDKGTILTSTNGKDWSKVDLSGKEVDLYSVASSGNEIVATGDSGTVFVSKDGVLWEQRRMATEEKIQRAQWINDRYYAVGAPMLILSSIDGITWDEVKAEQSSKIMFSDIAWDEDKYIVVGEHLNIWISKDGQIWDYNEAVLNKEGMDSTLCIYSVVWTGDKFIAVGDKGEILSSTDGSDWQREDYVTNRNLKDIIYSEGKFIAIGEKGIILSSDDGIKWNNHYNISVEVNNINLKIGQQKLLNITLKYPFGDLEDITGETLFEVVEGTDVLSVTEDGEIKALGVGKALVKANYDTKTLEISVNVEDDTAQSGEKDQGEEDNSPVNRSLQFSNILIAVASVLAVIALAFILMKKNKD